LCGADFELIGLALALAVLLCLGECPQLCIPFRFQRSSDESIVGINAKKTTAGNFRFVSGTILLRPAQLVGFIQRDCSSG
jgi:hypothetical protein